MKMIRKFGLWIFKGMLAFLLISIFSVVLFRFVPLPVTPVMIIRMFEAVFEGNMNGIEKNWVSYDEVSNNLFRAVVAAEDARFMSHSGIDWRAVEEARKYNERYKGRKKRGASTITMQTSKNAFLWHGRNYLRKALEVYFTYLIEFIWGKKRILEVYANIVEWGPGLYGVEAASKKYFGKSAYKLSRREAALLAAVLPNPRRWSPDKPTNYINRRAGTIQARMNSVPIPKK